jgi:glycosyltransferase involved in cell wall biosynthesis
MFIPPKKTINTIQYYRKNLKIRINMHNTELSIVIPTYNRMEILKSNLLLMLNDIKKNSIPIYISDDSTDDFTEKLIIELQQEYQYIFYHKNEINLGHDKNYLRALKLSNEKFTWFLGDSMIIKPNAIEHILQIINTTNSYSFIVVNDENRNFTLNEKLFTDKNEILHSLAWHLTLSGSTIYSRHTIESINENLVLQYANFPQIAIIFNFLNNNGNNLLWTNKKYIYTNKTKTSYWSNKILETFTKDFIDVIMSLDKTYTSKNKLFAIKNHSRYTGLFGYKNLVELKSKNVITPTIYEQYAHFILKASHENPKLIQLIITIPHFIYTSKLLRKILLFTLKLYKKVLDS